jgi:hypothetical protein
LVVFAGKLQVFRLAQDKKKALSRQVEGALAGGNGRREEFDYGKRGRSNSGSIAAGFDA